MKNHLVLYVCAGLVVMLLGGVALFSWHAAEESRDATAKAEQLQTALATAGMRAPTTDQIVRTLGDDGGAVCFDPGSALRRGVLYGQLTNGAAGPGQRPVIADNKVVKGQLLIVEVYCPQYLDRFQQVVDDLKLAEVA
jgi:Tfp pilus assembly protein FimT